MTIQVGGTNATPQQIASLQTTLGVVGPNDPVSAITYDTFTPPRITGYTQDGVAYTFTYGSNGVATKTGGGHTTTYNYNSSGQLTGSTVS